MGGHGVFLFSLPCQNIKYLVLPSLSELTVERPCFEHSPFPVQIHIEHLSLNSHEASPLWLSHRTQCSLVKPSFHLIILTHFLPIFFLLYPGYLQHFLLHHFTNSYYLFLLTIMPPQRGYHTVTQMGAQTPMGIINTPPRAMWKSPFMIWTAWGEKRGAECELKSYHQKAKGKAGSLGVGLRSCKMPKGSGRPRARILSFSYSGSAPHGGIPRSGFVWNSSNGLGWKILKLLNQR